MNIEVETYKSMHLSPRKMQSPTLLALSFILTILSLLDPIQAVQYKAFENVTGTPGNARFDIEVGIPYTKVILENAAKFIWKTFKQKEEKDTKQVKEVIMVLDSIGGIAYALDNEIHLSVEYVGNYSGTGNELKKEIIGILYHESTHVWQWNGHHDVPGGLIEGIADYVRLKAGLAPGHWIKKGGGDRWDQGYAVTAYFLDYCSELMDGFVATLNLLMKYEYREEYFVQLLGRSVHVLWKDYKAKYGG